MGVDADFDGYLREIVQFLESLCDIDLPLKIENARENLLHRSRTKLSTIGSCRVSTSPEPYLDMNAGKGLLLFRNRKEIEIEEYVGVEEQSVDSRPSRPDYYETFQDIGNGIGDKNNKIAGTTRTTITKKFDRREEADDKLITIYKTFTPAMTMNKAQKFGQLDYRVERKSFGFVRGNIRSCWIGLVGSHLLIYTSEKDKQPPEILSIRGYMGRPASNTTIKDQDHVRSAFEIFCPGNKTLQFTAKTSREMEDWLTAIDRTNLNVQDRDSGMYERSMDEKIDMELTDHNAEPEERYQEVEELLATSKHDVEIVATSSPIRSKIDNEKKMALADVVPKKDSPIVRPVPPPALPIRLPRSLPSLPNEDNPISSYEPLTDVYDEDDIYHRIDDFHDDRTSYENVKKKFGKRSKTKKSSRTKNDRIKKKSSDGQVRAPYDDVENTRDVGSFDDENRDDRRKSISRESHSRKIVDRPTYDDVAKIVRDRRTSVIQVSTIREKSLTTIDDDTRCSYATYDDVIEPPASFKTPVDNAKTENSEMEDSSSTSPAKSPTKSSHKRSFLDRVRNRKESPKKDEKKKIEAASASEKKLLKKDKKKSSLERNSTISKKSVEIESGTYDDVSGYFDDGNSQSPNRDDTTIVTKIDEFSNYNYPPPPRPVNVESRDNDLARCPNNDVTMIEDVYDDVGNYVDDHVDDNSNERSSMEIDEATKNLAIAKTANFGESTIPVNAKNIVEDGNKNVENGGKIVTTRVSCPSDDKSHDEATKLPVETEHYQIPRTEPRQTDQPTISSDDRQEQLYDDIAILAEFRSRPRDSISSLGRENSVRASVGTVDKLTITIKKPWNRFGSGKRLNQRDNAKNRSFDDLDDANDSKVEKTDSTKTNKLKKLINKMETTLGKQSPIKSANSSSSKTQNFE